MSVAIWRIAADTPDYDSDDLSGKGAELSGGRWNRKGHPVVYTAGSIALACLETYVHLGLAGLPLNRYLVRIDVPDDVWAARRTFDPRGARAVGWDATPAGRVSLDAGDRWLATGASALLAVPSVIVPEEVNLLINPRHADCGRLQSTKVRRWTFDPRMRG